MVGIILKECAAMTTASPDIRQSILEAVKGFPVWQQDAFRRLSQNVELSKADLEEILQLVKQQAGIKYEKPVIPAPITDVDLIPASPVQTAASLAGIQKIKHVAKLPADIGISFAPSGLNIVYGDNGSGKSSYVTILKAAGISRQKPTKILSNVFQANPNSPASATFQIASSTAVTEVDWIFAPSTTVLGQLAVFDKSCAQSILEERAKLISPLGLNLFGRLRDLCGVIDRKITEEISSQQQALPVLPELKSSTPNTAAKKLLESVRGNKSALSKEDLDKACAFSSEDEKKLKEVREQLDSPAALKQSLEQQQKELSEFLVQVPKIAKLVGNDSQNYLDGVISGIASLTELNGKELDALKGLPIPNVDSSTWRDMFQAAVTFAAEVYPQQDYPTENQLCVLCQQPLSNAEPMLALKNYFAGVVRTQLTQKTEEKTKYIGFLNNLDTPNTIPAYAAQAFRERVSPDFLSSVQAWIEAARKRKAVLKDYAESQKQPEMLPTLPELDMEQLQAAQEAISNALKELANAQTPEARAALVVTRHELEDRLILSSHVSNLHKFREVSQGLASLMQAKQQVTGAVLTKITNSHKQIASEFLTAAFTQKFEEEVKALGADKLAISLSKPRGDNAETHIGLIVSNAQQNVDTSIFSEGERRAIALAGFLTEYETQTTLVFDDPVTSLDHKYKERIAERLVKLSQAKQIIVLTHDLHFLYLLTEANHQVNTAPAHIVGLLSSNEFAGVVDGDAHYAWNSKGTGQQISDLQKECAELKALHSDAMKFPEYPRKLAGFLIKLRRSWELMVEKTMLNGVVGRFEKSIKTQSLDGVVITDDMVNQIFERMSFLSAQEAHCNAPPTNNGMLEPTQARAELDAFETFFKNQKKEGEAARKVRVDKREKNGLIKAAILADSEAESEGSSSDVGGGEASAIQGLPPSMPPTPPTN